MLNLVGLPGDVVVHHRPRVRDLPSVLLVGQLEVGSWEMKQKNLQTYAVRKGFTVPYIQVMLTENVCKVCQQSFITVQIMGWDVSQIYVFYMGNICLFCCVVFYCKYLVDWFAVVFRASF